MAVDDPVVVVEGIDSAARSSRNLRVRLAIRPMGWEDTACSNRQAVPVAVVEEHNFVACCMAKFGNFDIVTVIEDAAKGTGKGRLVRSVAVDS